jgi:hypothetical protein
VDAVPLVLWSGATPRVVLRYELDSNPRSRRVEQRFVRADGRTAAPFPLAASDTLPAGAATEDPLDLYEPGCVTIADVDGDGTDELVLPRSGGSVDVLGAERVVARTPGLFARGKLARYVAKQVHRARARGKDVLLALYERRVLAEATEADLARAGFAERHLLVRIDDRGAARLRFEAEGFRPEEIVAVGALNRPGSEGLDEIVAVSRLPGGRRQVISRHAPDGALLAPPREVYGRFSASAGFGFEFVAQSRRAVAFDPSSARVYFVAAEKPANWLRVVELPQLADASGAPQLLSIADAATAPKAIVRTGNSVFAVDEEGAFYTAPGGTWTRSAKPEPLFRMSAPSPQHHLVDVVPSADGGEPFLAVYSRGAGARKVPEEELVAAAERFLSPEELRRARAELEPSIEGRDLVRDDLIGAERARTGGDPPRSVEDWRARFPESYAAWIANARQNYRIGLEVALLGPGERARDGYRDFDGWLAWRKAQSVPAETTFALVRRGGVAARVAVAGEYPFGAESVLSRSRVAFRARGNAVTAVLALDVGDRGRPARRFVVVTGP